ncbi:uncharacterized protein [Drosophila bipectinata]|uniref:uncharacterized protein isoform X4 n=1 Tax=Drosophila bipectinata TaxID=42026 RepID=UPI0038B30A8F
MTTTVQMERNPNGGGPGGMESAGEAPSAAAAGGEKNAPIVGVAGQQKALDATKRKKLKSRLTSSASTAEMQAASAASTINQSNSGKIGRSGVSYSKDHLDAWLENCLRDATNAQLSSSSEFLDFIPPTATVPKPMFVSQAGAQPQQQQQQQQQQPFPMRGQPYGMGTGTPFSLGIQRQSHSLSHRYPMLFPPQSFNGYGMGYAGDSGQEFASLPPLVNMMGSGGGGGAGSEHEPNSTDVLDGSGSNPNFSRGFRFSDPCLLNPSDNDSKVSGQNTPYCRNGNISGSACDLAQQNQFFAALMEQIKILHDTNSRICQNLHETKGAYTPGMMTDVVREVKEAARVREDALLSRVKSMVEERQWSVNDGNVRILRDIDELKSHVMQLRLERKETNKRLTHLEAENKYLRQALASCYNQRQSYQDIIYENDRARGARKPFPNGGGAVTRRAHSFNLHYGTVHQTPTQATHSLEEDDEGEEENVQEQAELDSEVQSVVTNKRLSCSSNESRSNGMPTPPTKLLTQPTSLEGSPQSVRIPPSFALITDQVDPSHPPPLLPRKKEHAQIKRELSEAAAARKEANQRIIALEKLVKDLGVQVALASSAPAPAPAPAPAAAAALTTKFSVAGGPVTDL